MKRIALPLLPMIALLLSCETAVSSAGGSGTDVGNPTVVARLNDDSALGYLYGIDGEPVVGAVVSMVDTAHNPLIVSNALPLLKESTDLNGNFSLKRPSGMEGYTLFAEFPNGSGFAFSPSGVESDSLEFSVLIGPPGAITLLLPKTNPLDTAGLLLWLKGSEIWGAAGAIYTGDYRWGAGDSLFIGLKLEGIPFGFAPELRWYNSKAERGDWIVRGYPIFGDELQIVVKPCEHTETLCVYSIYRIPATR